MNVRRRIQLLEARTTLEDSRVLTSVYVATQLAAEQRKHSGHRWPMSTEEIQTIPHLAEILNSTYTNAHGQKIVESLPILIDGRDRQQCSDEQGRFILLASIIGPIKVRGVAPCRPASYSDDSAPL